MNQRTILITGANKGVGFAIVHRLASVAPDHIYLLAVRSDNAGKEAILKLRDLGITATLKIIELDITSVDQVRQAVESIDSQHGKLDVLINNAAIATVPEPDISLEHLRKIYDDTFNTNITSIAVLTTALLPLLRHSRDPRVINISSGRASMHAMTTGSLPPTVSVAYSVSKLAMNALMLEFAKQEDEVRPHQGSKILYQAVNPGHCKTSLNGFRGKRDLFEGVKVVEEMVLCQRDKHETGFWMWEGDEESGQLERMIW